MKQVYDVLLVKSNLIIIASLRRRHLLGATTLVSGDATSYLPRQLKGRPVWFRQSDMRHQFEETQALMSWFR